MSVADIDATKIERRSLLSGPKNMIIGTLFGLTPVTAILILGWFMRDMRRVALGQSASHPDTPPRWIFGEADAKGLARLLGGLAANIRAGLMTFVALALATLPFAGLWIASWWAGWDNSFNKGYEQAFVGPASGMIGVAIFMVAMVYVPMAQAHLAAEDRLSAFFEFSRVRSALRHSGWRYVWWTAGILFFALPVFAARGLPTFVEGLVPGFSDFTASQVDDLKFGISASMSLYVFATLLIFRRRQARIYARAVGRALAGADAKLWASSQAAAHIRPGPKYRPWRAMALLRFALLLAFWWGLAALIFIGQFLNHEWVIWLSHPLVFLPWMP